MDVYPWLLVACTLPRRYFAKLFERRVLAVSSCFVSDPTVDGIHQQVTQVTACL